MSDLYPLRAPFIPQPHNDLDVEQIQVTANIHREEGIEEKKEEKGEKKEIKQDHRIKVHQ